MGMSAIVTVAGIVLLCLIGFWIWNAWHSRQDGQMTPQSDKAAIGKDGREQSRTPGDHN